MPVTTKLGLDAKLYLNTASYATPTWSEVKNCKDLTLGLESSEADVTTRESGGWKAVVAALKEATIEFQMVYDPGDTNWEAIRDAWLEKTPLEFAVMDGGITTNGSQGLRAAMAVLKFSESQNLEEALMTDVSIKPTRSDNAPAWYTISA